MPAVPTGVCLLNGHRAPVRELLKVWLQRQVVMDRLHIGGQHLAGLGDVHMGVDVCASVSAHGAAVGAVSDGGEGCETSGLAGPSRGCVCDARRVGGVANGRGACPSM